MFFKIEYFVQNISEPTRAQGVPFVRKNLSYDKYFLHFCHNKFSALAKAIISDIYEVLYCLMISLPSHFARRVAQIALQTLWKNVARKK